MPVLFREHHVSEERIAFFKDVSPLKQIRGELAKFKAREPTQIAEFELVAGKNLVDAAHDQSCEACLTRVARQDLLEPNFQPVRLAIPERLDIGGVWYLLKATVHQEPSLVMAGGGLRCSLVKAVKISHFLKGLIFQLSSIAEEENLTGGLYTAVGKGRIAQRSELVDGLKRFMSPPLTLPPEEYIFFPTDYPEGPITEVAKIQLFG